MSSANNSSDKRLVNLQLRLDNEKYRLEEIERRRQETSDLIIHDLRNPLNTLMISLKMLQMGLPAEIVEENRDLFEIAEASGEKMSHIVDTLLETSKIEAGENCLQIDKCDLKALIIEVVKQNTLLNRKWIEISIQIPGDLPLMNLDCKRMDRVLVNLLENAMNHSPERGKIVISAGIETEQIWVSFMDNGPGIAQEDREHIFERFLQLGAEKQNRRGFGLGLTYCKHTIQAHGGQIWVEDGENGSGSRFIFTLPFL